MRHAPLLLCLWAAPAWALPSDGGLWTSLLTMADGNTEQAVERADAVRSVFAGIAGGIRIDEQSLGLLHEIREATIELNLGKLFKMLPMSDGEGRLVRQQGVPIGDTAYSWTLFPGIQRSDAIGEVAGHVRMEPAVDYPYGNGKAYNFDVLFEMGTGGVTSRDVALVFEGFLERWAIRGRHEPNEATRAALGGRHPRLGEDDLALLAVLQEDFPAAMAVLGGFARVDNVGAYHGELLEVDLRVRLSDDDLAAAGFAKLSRYLRRMDEILEGRIVLVDQHGHPVFVVGARSRDLSMRVQVATLEGAVIPWGASGFQADEPMRPSDPSVNLRMRVEGEAHSDGVVVKITDYEMPLAYRSGGGEATMAVDIRTEPDLDLSGEGVIMSWLTELADSALNLESHGQVVFKAVAHGPDGEGSRARMRYRDGEQGRLEASMQGTLVDNGMIRFAMRMVGGKLAPSDTVVTDFVSVFSTLIFAMDQDYQRARPALLVETSEG
jgi:hypothetical protein